MRVRVTVQTQSSRFYTAPPKMSSVTYGYTWCWAATNGLYHKRNKTRWFYLWANKSFFLNSVPNVDRIYIFFSVNWKKNYYTFSTKLFTWNYCNINVYVVQKFRPTLDKNVRFFVSASERMSPWAQLLLLTTWGSPVLPGPLLSLDCSLRVFQEVLSARRKKPTSTSERSFAGSQDRIKRSPLLHRQLLLHLHQDAPLSQDDYFWQCLSQEGTFADLMGPGPLYTAFCVAPCHQGEGVVGGMLSKVNFKQERCV